MVTAPCTKDPVTAKIGNVASRGIVCFPEKSSEIVLRQITQDRDSPRAVHPRYVSELIERKTWNAKAQQPTPARAGENLWLSDSLFSQRTEGIGNARWST